MYLCKKINKIQLKSNIYEKLKLVESELFFEVLIFCHFVSDMSLFINRVPVCLILFNFLRKSL